MRFTGWTLLAVAALMAVAPTTLKAQVVVNQTFDLTTAGMNSSGVYSQGSGIGFSPTVSAQFGVGQTLTLNYDFGAYGISASNVTTAWADIWDWNPVSGVTNDGAPYSNVSMTGTLSLLDSFGNAIFTTPSVTNVEGSVHVGQYFSGLSTGSLTFYGVQYNGLLTAMSVGTSRAYNLPGLTLQGSNFSLVQAPINAAVPEPATWAMMLLGFGGMGVALRRRRKPAVAQLA